MSEQNCKPEIATATLVDKAPALIVYRCTCGSEDHWYSAVAYEVHSSSSGVSYQLISGESK